MKFRSKPVEIEAEQWFPNQETRGVCGANLSGTCAKTGRQGSGPHVHTAHGSQVVYLDPGDWIIKEPTGDGYYPCKPDIFEKRWEAIT